MHKKFLQPEQIIALKDYPLHNEQILKIYFRVFHQKQGKILPPCPVIHRSIGVPYALQKDQKSLQYNTVLNRFLKNHPYAEYFLLDGNHKSIAAALSHQPLPVIVLRDANDFIESKKMVACGKLFGWYAVPHSVDDALHELREHFHKYFSQKPHFYTVKEKADILVKNKDVPDYMITEYVKK